MASNRKNRFKPPSILEFERRFATEEDCSRFLFEKRWPKGWTCPRCGGIRIVELDESFFGAPKEGGCRGRSTAKKIVLAGLSLAGDGKPRHIRLQVLPRLDRAHLEPAIQEMVAPGATIKIEGLRSYAYRYDRRHRPDAIFDRCVAAVAACPVWTYRGITDAKPVCRKARLQAA